MKYTTIYALLFCLMPTSMVLAKNDLETAKLKGRVKSVTTNRWEVTGDTSSYQKSRLISTRTVSYNQAGMVSTRNGSCEESYSGFYRSNGKHSMIHFYRNSKSEYDTNNRLISNIEYGCKDSVEDSTVYLYDIHGNISFMKVYNAEGHLDQKVEYRYNKQNKCIEEQDIYDTVTRVNTMHYNDNGDITDNISRRNNKLLSELKYNYNTGGKLVEEILSWKDKRVFRHTYLYDKKGRLIDNINYGENDTIDTRHLYIYDDNTRNKIRLAPYYRTETYFDRHGKMTTKHEYRDNKLSQHDTFDNRSNNILSVAYSYNANGARECKEITKIAYDKYNNEISQSLKYEGQGFKEWRKNKYDKEGNLILQVDFEYGRAELATEIEILYY